VYVSKITLYVSNKAMNTPFHTAIFYTYEWLRIKLCFFLKIRHVYIFYYLSSLSLGDLSIKTKVTFTIKQAMKAQKGSKGIVLLFLEP
jgi:hypothetical protein